MGQLQGLKSILSMVQQLAIEFKTNFPDANNISNASDMPQSEGEMFQGSMHENPLLALQQFSPSKYRHSKTVETFQYTPQMILSICERPAYL